MESNKEMEREITQIFIIIIIIIVGVLLSKCSGTTNQTIYSNSNGNHNSNWKVKSMENIEDEESSVLVEIIYTKLKGEANVDHKKMVINEGGKKGTVWKMVTPYSIIKEMLRKILFFVFF